MNKRFPGGGHWFGDNGIWQEAECNDSSETVMNNYISNMNTGNVQQEEPGDDSLHNPSFEREGNVSHMWDQSAYHRCRVAFKKVEDIHQPKISAAKLHKRTNRNRASNSLRPSCPFSAFSPLSSRKTSSLSWIVSLSL